MPVRYTPLTMLTALLMDTIRQVVASQWLYFVIGHFCWLITIMVIDGVIGAASSF